MYIKKKFYILMAKQEINKLFDDQYCSSHIKYNHAFIHICLQCYFKNQFIVVIGYFQIKFPHILTMMKKC